MAKILLVNPVIRQSDKPRHAPFGLAQLASIVIKNGHKLQVFDCNAWRPSDRQIRNVLAADDWEVIALGGLITSYKFIKHFSALAKEVCPSTILILGGGVITPIPREIMGIIREVDIGVIGEGYLTFPELLSALDGGTLDLAGIRGIAWRDGGEVVVNEARELLEEVDSLPFPSWELFPLDIYFKNSSLLLSEESMLARRRLEFCCSYGCPFKCKYCFHLGLSGELSVVEDDRGRRDVKITHRRRVRWHSPDYVVSLASYAKDRYGCDFLSFLDENFVALERFTKGKWMDEFEDLWIRAGLRPNCVIRGIGHDPKSCSGLHWGTTCHAGLADLELFRRLKSLGCSHLDFGFESFSDEILKDAGKGATKAMNVRALKISMRAGIRAIPNQMLGFPNETMDSILENLAVWEELGIKAYPFLATPYPGSTWYYQYKKRILDQYDGSLDGFLSDLGDATTLTALISNHFNAVEILGLRELMGKGDRRRIEEYRVIWQEKFNRQQFESC